MPCSLKHENSRSGGMPDAPQKIYGLNMAPDETSRYDHVPAFNVYYVFYTLINNMKKEAGHPSHPLTMPGWNACSIASGYGREINITSLWHAVSKLELTRSAYLRICMFYVTFNYAGIDQRAQLVADL